MQQKYRIQLDLHFKLLGACLVLLSPENPLAGKSHIQASQMDAPRTATSSPIQALGEHAEPATTLGVHFYSDEVYGLLPSEQRCLPDASIGACLTGSFLECCCGGCLQVQRANGWIQNICAQQQFEERSLCETRPLRDPAMCDECVCCRDTRLGVTWAWSIKPWAMQPLWLRAAATTQQALCMVTIVCVLPSLLLVTQLQQGIDLHNSVRFLSPAGQSATAAPKENVQPAQDHYAFLATWLFAAGCMLWAVSAAVHASWHCLPPRERYFASQAGVHLTEASDEQRLCKRYCSVGKHSLWVLPVLLLVGGLAAGLVQSSSSSAPWGSAAATSLVQQQLEVLDSLQSKEGKGFEQFAIGMLLAASCSVMTNWLAVFLLQALLAARFLLTGASMLCHTAPRPALWVQRQSPLHAWGARAAVAEWAGLQISTGWHTLPATSAAFAASDGSNSERSVAPSPHTSGARERALAQQLVPRRRPLGASALGGTVPSLGGSEPASAAAASALISETAHTLHARSSSLHSFSSDSAATGQPSAGRLAHLQSAVASPVGSSRDSGVTESTAGSSRDGRHSGATEPLGSTATAPPLYTLRHFDPQWPAPLEDPAVFSSVPTAWVVDIDTMQLLLPLRPARPEVSGGAAADTLPPNSSELTHARAASGFA